MLSLDQTNTTRFLFGEEEGATSPEVKNYLHSTSTDDKFPILVRRDEYPGLVKLFQIPIWNRLLTGTCSSPLPLQLLTLLYLNHLVLIQTAGAIMHVTDRTKPVFR